MRRSDLQSLSRWAPAIAGCIALAILVGGFAWAVSSINSAVAAISARQQVNSPKVDEAKNAAKLAAEGVAILQDCLTPGGKCYAANQATQASILHEVSELQTYHSLCIRNPHVAHTITAVDACVALLIKEHGLG